MPFKSKSQMRTCYSKRARGEKNWDCDKWMEETKNPECLPEKKGMPRPKKCGKKIVLGKTMYGPRGGRYFLFGEYKIYF